VAWGDLAIDNSGEPMTKAQYIELFLVQGKGAWHLAAEKGVSPSVIEQLRHERNTLYSTLLCQEPLIKKGFAANGLQRPLPARRIRAVLPKRFARFGRTGLPLRGAGRVTTAASGYSSCPAFGSNAEHGSKNKACLW
jgi:hypothetical protein